MFEKFETATAVQVKGNKMTSIASYRNQSQRPAARAVAQSRRQLSRPAKLFRTAILLALLITAVSQVAQWQSAQATSHGISVGAATASTTYVSVHAGQTLWSLAVEYAPNTDPRDWIDQVQTMNQLATPDVQPGQRIAIPAN